MRPMKAQLTIRDLFWLVLVCAMACGWLARGTSGQFPIELAILALASVVSFGIGFTVGAVVNDAMTPRTKD